MNEHPGRHKQISILAIFTATIIAGILIATTLVYTAEHDQTPQEPPLADNIAKIEIANFRRQHPRLPAPTADDISQIQKHYPNVARATLNVDKHSPRDLYRTIVKTTFHPTPASLNEVYRLMTNLKFSGRGDRQAKPLAQAYDWLYDSWSAEQKQNLQQKLAEGCRYLIDVIDKQQLSPYNVFLYNSPFQALMATAIALYQDHPYGGKCMHYTRNLWINRVLPVWRQIMGKNGGWHEGLEYVGIGIGQAVYQVPAMWRKATGEDLFKTEAGIKGFLDFLIYRTRPDGTHMRWGDGAYFDRIVSDRLALAIEYNHKAAYSFKGCPRPFASSTYPWGPLTTDRLCDSNALHRLPLEKHFDGIGMVVARSNWDNDATYVTFKAGDNYWSHSHLDQGSFTLYKGGPLIIDSGLYGPRYGSDHHMNYSYQSIAHNVITVTDEQDNVPAPGKDKKPPRPIANDGGQRRIGSGWGVEPAPMDLNEWLNKKDLYHSGKIEKYYADENFVIAIADLTPAYTNQKSGSGAFSARSRRVEDYWRTFIYDKKLDIVIIHDDITSTDKNFVKRSIFHTINQPQQENNKIVSRVLSNSPSLFNQAANSKRRFCFRRKPTSISSAARALNFLSTAKITTKTERYGMSSKNAPAIRPNRAPGGWKSRRPRLRIKTAF
nr:heparinase II/III family protein [Methylomarinum sp. Ch1-1]MDP4521187.1 heparinase II/III family protein [Methylomarinum sp. Ch1-1]